VSRELASRLHRETEGLPLLVVEYLTAITNGTLSTEDRDWALPGGARQLLQSRLRGVGETSWQILTTGAAIGRSFEFETVREASGRSEDEAVEALEELIAQGLVKEVTGRAGAPTYDFSHDKVRALVYEETSLARRRLLHRRIAESLAARAHEGRDPGQLAGQIASHYAAAGHDAEAADYFKLAGEHARSLYAYAEAVAHFKSALALGHPNEVVLHEAIGDLHTLLGEYKAALASYEAAAALVGDHWEVMARLDAKLGGVYARRGEWELAEGHVADALAAWGLSGPEADRARAYADLSLIARNRGQLDRAEGLARQALDLATSAGDARALAQAHNVLGMLANGQRKYDLALEHLSRSLALAETLRDATVRIAALNNLALVQAARGHTAEARELIRTALELCETQGDRHREAALHNNLADLLRTSGDIEAAMAHLKTAVVIFAEIGAEAGTPQPEIWKLTEW
jgi:tetratricopeptide (TPR) repeat protein